MSKNENSGPSNASVDPVVMRRTPLEIAESWYDSEGIEKAIMSAGDGSFGDSGQIPPDVKSKEFAKWLTCQYRLAMAKGIQLGRDCSEDKPPA